MHGGDRVPILVGHLVDQIVADDPGIVDQHIERAEPQHDLLDHRLDLGGDRDIGFDADRLDAVPGRDAGGGFLGARAVEIGDRDHRAVLGEPLGRCLADAAGAAGHQRDASFRTSTHVLS